jgi:hypothetical protein
MSSNSLPLAASCLHDTIRALHAEKQGSSNGCPCYAIVPFVLEHLHHWFVWLLAYAKMFTEGFFAGYLFLELNVMDLPRPLPVDGHRAVILLWTRSTQQRPP